MRIDVRALKGSKSDSEVLLNLWYQSTRMIMGITIELGTHGSDLKKEKTGIPKDSLYPGQLWPVSIFVPSTSINPSVRIGFIFEGKQSYISEPIIISDEHRQEKLEEKIDKLLTWIGISTNDDSNETLTARMNKLQNDVTELVNKQDGKFKQVSGGELLASSVALLGSSGAFLVTFYFPRRAERKEALLTFLKELKNNINGGDLRQAYSTLIKNYPDKVPNKIEKLFQKVSSKLEDHETV